VGVDVSDIDFQAIMMCSVREAADKSHSGNRTSGARLVKSKPERLGGRMTQDKALEIVARVLAKVIEDKGDQAPKITADMALLGGDMPIDSLDLATVVIELQEEMGMDPFEDGFIQFRTVGELAKLYVY
jgi:acyl carrier protein